MKMKKEESYNKCKKICKEVYLELCKLIKDKEVIDVLELSKRGNEMIIKMNGNVYYPVSISLNNCIGGYIYEKGNEEYNKIKKGDIVKIDFGVNIGNTRVMFGDTFEMGTDENSEYIKLLNNLKNSVKDVMKPGNLNDDVKMLVESKCSELNCVPVENCISYEQNHSIDEAKYIVLNYTKYYDEDDRLILTNDCYEFEEGEIYDINLTIVKAEKSNSKAKHSAHIARFNDYFYNLKLKASKDFLKQCKGRYGTRAFLINEWNLNVKHRLGMRECKENGILEEYPIMYENELVFTKKFTVIV